jgi:sRNA-binding protein
MYDIDTTAASSTKGESVSNRRARKEGAKRVISLLAERSPAAFVADKWAPHRPLKVGIHADLLATGLLTPSEVRNALVVYTGRLQYQCAVAGGGARFDLDGNPTDEVTAEEMAYAAASVARHEARAIAKTETTRAIRQAAYAERKRAKKQAVTPTPSDNAVHHRDGLADLKAAAAARRNGGAL